MAIPYYFAEAQTRRPPVVLNKASRLVSSQPVGEVVELIAVGKNRRKADDTPLKGIRPLQQPLNLHLVADFALVRPIIWPSSKTRRPTSSSSRVVP